MEQVVGSEVERFSHHITCRFLLGHLALSRKLGKKQFMFDTMNQWFVSARLAASYC